MVFLPCGDGLPKLQVVDEGGIPWFSYPLELATLSINDSVRYIHLLSYLCICNSLLLDFEHVDV